jgi:hypothetical protein
MHRLKQAFQHTNLHELTIAVLTLLNRGYSVNRLIRGDGETLIRSNFSPTSVESSRLNDQATAKPSERQSPAVLVVLPAMHSRASAAPIPDPTIGSGRADAEPGDSAAEEREMGATPSPARETDTTNGAATGPINTRGAKPWQAVSKAAGYGMPCVACRTYYPIDLPACPVCQSTERVSPVAVPLIASKAAVEESCPDPAVLEQERERFLREFKVQMLASQMQPQPAGDTRCAKADSHPSNSEAAAVCQSCYDQLQERVDVLEAALHIDIKEAAQIVYDAVWADSSDSSKSYENAATALLTELRRRSGVTQTFGLMKPLND